MRKGLPRVELLVELHRLLLRTAKLGVDVGNDAAGKIATVGDKVDGVLVVGLQLHHALGNLLQVLMLERLVHRQVVRSPAEVG